MQATQRRSNVPTRRYRSSDQGSGRARNINVSDPERWLSLAGGFALAGYGLTRGAPGGLCLALAGGALAYRGYTGHCHLYGALDINTAGRRGERTSVPASHGIKVEESITIMRSPDDLFRFWRNFENLPRVMSHLKSVKSEGTQRSHWIATGPLGTTYEWDAEVYNERPNEMIAWRSIGSSEVDTAGSVHFTRPPGGRGTLVRVILKYDPPAGKVGAAIAKLFGQEPGAQIREDLRRFKENMEAGEGRTPWTRRDGGNQQLAGLGSRSTGDLQRG